MPPSARRLRRKVFPMRTREPKVAEGNPRSCGSAPHLSPIHLRPNRPDAFPMILPPIILRFLLVESCLVKSWKASGSAAKPQRPAIPSVILRPKRRLGLKVASLRSPCGQPSAGSLRFASVSRRRPRRFETLKSEGANPRPDAAHPRPIPLSDRLPTSPATPASATSSPQSLFGF